MLRSGVTEVQDLEVRRASLGSSCLAASQAQALTLVKPDLNIGTAGVALGVVAFIGVAGGACWFVLSGQWSLMLMKLEQTIRS